MPCLSGPWWLHPPNTRVSSPYNFFLAIQNVGNGCGWSYQPTSSKGHQFILTITDYFSKWAKAIPLREIKTSNVIKFIKYHMVYHFGMPWRIVHDNGPQFVSQSFYKFCNKFRIQSVSSMAYYPAANGLAEVFNKTIGKLLKKFISKSHHDWDDKLCECLSAYHTTVKTLTKATLFSLVYEC